MALDMNWDYVAGLFDGEGSVCIPNGAHFMPRVAIYQSGERGRVVLTQVKRFVMGEDMIVSRLYPYQRGKRKLMWSLIIEKREDTACFLTWILPYVRVKKVDVQDHLRFMRVFYPLPAHKFWRNRRAA